MQSCFVGWEYSSIIEYLPSMLEILVWYPESHKAKCGSTCLKSQYLFQKKKKVDVAEDATYMHESQNMKESSWCQLEVSWLLANFQNAEADVHSTKEEKRSSILDSCELWELQ